MVQKMELGKKNHKMEFRGHQKKKQKNKNKKKKQKKKNQLGQGRI